MATSDILKTGTQSGSAGASHRLPRKVWYVGGAAAGAYIALLLSSDIGTTEGERIYNPDPPPPSDMQTFLGIRDTTWFSILYVVTALVLGWMLWSLARHYRATGRVQPAAVLLLAFTIFALWDPLINWATYTVFSPDLIHYPIDWPWFGNVAPVVETTWIWGGYGLFYMTPMLFGFWLWRTRVAPRAKPGSFVARHPLLSIGIFGVIFGFIFDVPTELFLMNMNIWHYWQWWGPAISIGNATLPLTEIFWTGMMIGAGMVLLHHDDRGRSQVAVMASRRPLAQRLHIGEKTMIIVLLTAVYACYLLSFGVLRVLDLAQNVEDEWPASTSKVYDPYGVAKENGIPGPYFKGFGAWTIR
jgi:hypothetical protein